MAHKVRAIAVEVHQVAGRVSIGLAARGASATSCGDAAAKEKSGRIPSASTVPAAIQQNA
jgi:hypothetical protein